MGRKKKYLLIFSFILLVAFSGITLDNSCDAFTYERFTSGDTTFICPQLESGDFKQIVEHFQLEWSFTGNYEDTLLPLINQNIFNTAYHSGDIAINNIAFFRHNGSSSSGDLFMLYFYGKDPMRFTGDYQNTSIPRLTFSRNDSNANTVIASGDYMFYGRKWNWFTYTSGSNPTINGVNATNITTYRIYASNNSISNPSRALIVPNWNYNGDTARVTTGEITLTPSEILNNPWSTPLWIHHPNFAILCQTGDTTQYAVFANTYQNGWGAYNYTNRIYLEDSNNPSSGSGDSGSVNLDETNSLITDVNSSINELNNTLTGDVNLNNISVTSGDIIDALGFTLMEDPYSNFWYTLTQNLNATLTSAVRTFSFQSPFDDSTITIDLDDYPVNFPETIQWLITTITVYLLVMIIMRYFHDIYVLITSGNVDEVLAMNEESGIVDLF